MTLANAFSFRRIAPNSVHVWYIDLDLPPQAVEAHTHVLSADEHARMQRYRFSRDARRFAVRRGALRCLLARYLTVTPMEIRYRIGPQGKLSLLPDDNPRDLRFNLSVSGEVAVCALTTGCEIGVDIEERRTLADAVPVAQRFFSPEEVAWFRQRPPEEQADGFLRCWTAKEAVIKAAGGGLSLPLQEFSVIHWESPAFVRWPARPEIEQADVRLLTPPAGFLATVVVLGAVDAVVEQFFDPDDSSYPSSRR